MNVVQYARVSLEMQDTEDKVSITQQLEAIDELCQRNGWQVVDVFVDNKNYKATMSPKKGKMVNPSGERADRPKFLEMLEVVKSGEADIVLCWRDDRLVRHPRVAVALEDALDVGDTQRNSKGKIEIKDATGATIDRFTLSIKATIWREENKRRAERTRMGKVATLNQGRWPGNYDCLGYRCIKEEGQRGRLIVIDDENAQTVETIFRWYDAGVSVPDIQRRLIAAGTPQQGRPHSKRPWEAAVIYQMLRNESYTGKLVWRFKTDKEVTIDIPVIIKRELWERIQARLDKNIVLSLRNTKGVYLLQGILECGECGGKMGAQTHRFFYKTLADGTRKRYEFKNPRHQYRCHNAHKYRLQESHPKPYTFGGTDLDWQVWRHLVDFGIKQPDLIREQVQERQRQLQTEGEDANGAISRACSKLEEIGNQRAFYQRQASRGKMTEAEFDKRMEETEEAQRHWQTEQSRLQELRDNTSKVQAGLDYATKLLATICAGLGEIDLTPGELKKLPIEGQRMILEERRRIVRALCDKVQVFTDGQVKIDGVFDGSEGLQFDLSRP